MMTAEKCKTSPDLHGHEELVDKAIEAAREMKEAESTLNECRKTLDEAVNRLRKRAASLGKFVTTVKVRGSVNSATYIYRNAFSDAPISLKDKIIDKLGKKLYNILFQEKEIIKIRPEMQDALKKRLGEEIHKYCEVKEVVTPQKEFLQKYFEVFDTLTEEEKSFLDELERNFLYRPQFKVD